MSAVVRALPPDPEGLKAFGVSPARGFLPEADPARELPALLHPWQELAAEIPKRLLAGRLGSAVEALSLLPAEAAETEPDRRAAMRALSFLGHAYVWERGAARPELPAVLAVPWRALARALGRPPVLSYASYALDNWRRLDPDGPIAAENVAILQNFLGGSDEDWFIAIHVEIEALAAPALRSLGPARAAAAGEDLDGLERALEAVAEALEAMNATLLRTPEHCDPYVYFHRVRPFIHGWKGHPALSDGLLYGAEAGGEPERLRLRGETGAQSSIVPCLDALLGVPHVPDPLRAYLDEMRDYMPPGHRAFLEAVEAGPPLAATVARLAGARPALAELRDACLHWLEAFRSTHLEFAARYIHQQACRQAANPSDVGTGGTPFMTYLRKHRDETAAARSGSERL
ncbi:MAG: indoleamine 2,3-dioxygenase [Proteobacteria bacterium]|nr:indoleamine 2,3-dioxygenase [Pseudomonadota bacterium]